MNKLSNEIPLLPDFLEERRQKLPMDLSFAHWQGSFTSWQENLRTLWLSTLPPCQGPAMGERILADNGSNISLTFATGARAQGRIQLPTIGKPPYPAVILLHDHGGMFEAGWQKLFQCPESTTIQARHYDEQVPANFFLHRGIAVLCVDALGWGSRFMGGYTAQQALAANIMGLGWNLACLVAGEDCQAAAWLADQPEIDADQIGAFGFSFGGFRAWQLASLSPVIKSAAALSWMAERQALMHLGAPLLKGQSAFYFLHPTLTARADFPDLAGLAAKKPLFFRSGHGDPHMPTASVRRAWQMVSAIYEAANGPRPDYAFHDHGHTCPRASLEEAADYLAAHLY